MSSRSKKERMKILLKQRESLLKIAEEHKLKAETIKTKNYAVIQYWAAEYKNFLKQAGEKENLIKKLMKKEK